MTATRSKEDLIRILSHDVLTNIVAKNTALNQTELIVTVCKLIRNDVFGLEKYLTWGVEPFNEPIRSSEHKNVLLEQMGACLANIGVNRQLIEIAGTVGHVRVRLFRSA